MLQQSLPATSTAIELKRNMKLTCALVGFLVVILDNVNGFSSLKTFIQKSTNEKATFVRHLHTESLFLSSINDGRRQSLSVVTADNSSDTIMETVNGDINVKLSTNEKARTVASTSTSGTLCTISCADGIEGAPFGSFVDYVLNDEGNPIFLMNEMSLHTGNIRDNNQVTLFVQTSFSMQDVSRCSITGEVEKLERGVNIDSDAMDAMRMRYSITHVYADQVMDSPKFHFYRLNPSKIYYVGGFGVQATWVPIEDYTNAEPDILAKEAAEIVSKLNRESYDDLVLTATHLLDYEEIEKLRVTNLDRLGLDIRVTKRGPRKNTLVTDVFRVGFRIPVISVEDAKSEIQKIFQEAWEKGQGYTWDSDEPPGSDVPIIKIAEDSLGYE